MPPNEVRELRERHSLGDGPVGLFLGSLVEDKRLDFLFEAAARVAAAKPDFRLLIVGDGPLRARVLDAAHRNSWIRYLGRIDEVDERAKVLVASDVLLMPGLVGLVALDSLAAAVPLVTTAVDFHSPEIEYIRNGTNGVILPDPNDEAAYASTILEIIEDRGFREELARGCRESRGEYTLAGMVGRFAEGVHRALAA